MSDTLRQTPTGGDTIALPPELPVSRTRTIEDLARDLTAQGGHVRNVTAAIRNDVADVHHQGFRIQLDAHTARLTPLALTDLLDSLNQLGFGWRDVARMIGVSVPALRRWRHGEMPTADHRRRVAELVALIEILTADHLVSEVAAWMEVPITSEVPDTPMDLYARGHVQTVFELATRHLGPEQALNQVEPGWRERIDHKYEVFLAADGQPAIRPRSASGR